jgi:hypothetical protein
MAVFRQLLQRWGFVKLDRYGLMLTPEGRVLTTRPAILDDGTGGRIVGWQDGDPAIFELKTCETSRAEAKKPREPDHAAATPPSIPAVSDAAEPPAPAPSAPVIAVAVAPEPVVDEDDWEWTIALAKARAVETIAIAPGPLPGLPSMAGMDRQPRVDQPGSGDHSWVAGTPPRARALTPAAMAVMTIPPREMTPRVGAPVTVIPVPALPTMQAAHAGRMSPVVRSIPPASMNRFAAGTGSVDPQPEPEQRPSPAKRPTGGLPAAARAVELPSVKRRNAPPR